MKIDQDKSESPTQLTRDLLPSLVKHPVTLLIAIVVPQVILLIINLNAYHLISGEINDDQRNLAIKIFGGECFVFMVGIGIALTFFLKKRKAIPWGYYWAILIPHCIYLVGFINLCNQVIPPSLQVWIVEPGALISSQFVCLMPGAFLAALCLACFPTNLSTPKDIGLSAGLTFGIPAFWYVIVHTRKLFAGGPIVEQFMTILFVLSTLVCLTGIMRILTITFNAVRKSGPLGQCLFIFIVAIAGPVGGLLLNRSIPFPADFQSVYIYLLAVGNGLVLMIPKLTHQKLNRAVWMAQCLFFPFTLYFFTVFLPYLPLAVVAMLAAGAGFLILVPTLLFIVHLKKLAEGATTRRAIISGILMTLVVPVYLFAEARLDRRAIHQAIDYVYSPDYEDGDRFNGSEFAVKRSLKRLQYIKGGRYLPFLTQIYNHIVLDNLVLSDTKMNHIYTSFFGEKLPTVQVKDSPFSRNRSDRDRRNSRLSTPPPTSAKLVNLETSEQVSDGMVKTLVKLELHNPEKFQSEFATTILIPKAMFVSGYWLHIGNERVPGKIFERKTAMWVYRMIRDATRRDPGLLTYLSPNELSLRVFPLASNETRTTEIEFLSPAGFSRTIRIGDRTIEGPAEPTALIIKSKLDDDSWISLNETAIRSLPRTSRMPYLHFIVDRSVTGLTDVEVVEEMKKAALEFPEIKDGRVTWANYELEDLNNGKLIPIDDLQSILKSPLPLRGNLMVSRALKRNLSHLDNAQSDKCPVFVFLTGPATDTKLDEGLTWLKEALPDFQGYHVKAGGREIQNFDFDGNQTKAQLEQNPVHLLKSGDKLTAVPASGTGATLKILSSGEVSVYNPELRDFKPLAVSEAILETSLYSRAAAGWIRNLETIHNPAKTNELLPEIVKASRESGILLPDTAYMVVENSAQWKVLQQKEKKKLKGNHALDHMETPEPGWWLVLLGYLGYLAVRFIRSGRYHFSALRYFSNQA